MGRCWPVGAAGSICGAPITFHLHSCITHDHYLLCVRVQKIKFKRFGSGDDAGQRDTHERMAKNEIQRPIAECGTKSPYAIVTTTFGRATTRGLEDLKDSASEGKNRITHSVRSKPEIAPNSRDYLSAPECGEDVQGRSWKDAGRLAAHRRARCVVSTRPAVYPLT